MIATKQRNSGQHIAVQELCQNGYSQAKIAESISVAQVTICHQLWKKVGIRYHGRLYKSMPQRSKVVIEANPHIPNTSLVSKCLKYDELKD